MSWPRLLAAALLLLPASVWGWGFTAHRWVNAAAVEGLEDPLKTFFLQHRDYVAEHAVDPDLWRITDEPEQYNHYLDADALAPYPFDQIPRDEAEVARKFGADAWKQGRGPWRIAELTARLREAFQRGRWREALDLAAALGHYVGDLHVPLHSAKNYNGQETGQLGIHHRWETDLIERFSAQLRERFAPDPAQRVGDVTELSFTMLKESYAEVAPLLAQDLELRGAEDYWETQDDDRYSFDYYSRLFARQEPVLRARLSLAATRLAALWHTAWVNAGMPAPPARPVETGPLRGSRKLVLFSWDGASGPLVEELIELGKLPHLARLRARGFGAGEVVPTTPTDTPVGHATIWTGAWPEAHGIIGSTLPRLPFDQHTLLETDSGFNAGRLKAEPLWVTAARQGLRAVVVQGTHSWPFEPYGRDKSFGGDVSRNLVLFNNYDQDREWAEVYQRAIGVEGFHFEVLGTPLHAVPFDDPADPTQGFDTVRLNAGDGQTILLKPLPPEPFAQAAFGAAVSVGSGASAGQCSFRLYELSPDGARLLLYRSPVYRMACSNELLGRRVRERLGELPGDGAYGSYTGGQFGPTLAQGGDGTAELRFMDTLEFGLLKSEELSLALLHQSDWDLIVLYGAFTDQSQHLWLGYLDPAIPGYDAERARRYRALLERVYARMDQYLGRVIDQLGPETILWVVSDHGHKAGWKNFQPNVVLKHAGLLATGPEGRALLEHTSALTQDGFAIWLNTTDHKGGIVTPEQRPQVLAAVRAALLAATDPETGAAIVTKVYDLRAGELPGLAGPGAPDLFLGLAPGYYSVATLQQDAVVIPGSFGGKHDFAYEGDRRLSPISIAAGPGITPGARLESIHQVDIAPTAAALLGIQPPRQAEGRILTEILDSIDSALLPAAQ